MLKFSSIDTCISSYIRRGYLQSDCGWHIRDRFTLSQCNLTSPRFKYVLKPTMSLSTLWTSFLKSISSFNGDLSTMTAPPFILSPVSLVEYSQYWGEHPDLFLDPVLMNKDGSTVSSCAPDVRRLIAVTRWFISTLRSQYCSRSESMGTEKKPLNPFLGEVFVGKWPDSSVDGSHGDTILISEQVSHHPPVTAYTIKNDKNKVLLQGYNGIKASISATLINVKQYGHAILDLKDCNETYLITFPPLHIEGIITASPFVELEGTSYIQSSSGALAVIDYSGRGFFSGKKNTFKANIFPDLMTSSNRDNAIVNINGQWSGKSYIEKGSCPTTSSSELFYNALNNVPETLVVKPIEEQNNLELRKAWQPVAEAIRLGNYDTIHEQKTKIEEAQRKMRKSEKARGDTWKTRWFDEKDLLNTNAGDDPLISLAKVASLSIENIPLGAKAGSKHERGQALHWRFNEDKWNKEKVIQV